MNRVALKIIYLNILFFTIFGEISFAAAGKRIALVIGNSNYARTAPLANPTNDAEDLGKILSGLGFEVIVGIDLDKRAMDGKLADFAGTLIGAEIGLFFYAGHGLQVAGQNYLVPVDAELKSASALEFEAVSLNVVQRIMENETQTNVLILDACRDNPLSRNLARSLGTRSGSIGKGLAPQESGAGTLISYSTQPGNVALDGVGGRNSPYAEALVKHLPTTGKGLSSILVNVRNDVMAATANRQVPWEHSALTRELILTDGSASAAPESDGLKVDVVGAMQTGQAPASDSATAPEGDEGEAAVARSDPPEALPSAAGLDFVDSFEGDKPAEHWTVKNEDPNGYIVENGAVFLVTSKEGGVVTAPNVFELKRGNPEGDWDMLVDLRPDFGSGYDGFQLGLVDGDNSPIKAVLQLWRSTDIIGRICNTLLLSVSGGAGEQVQYDTVILASSPTSDVPSDSYCKGVDLITTAEFDSAIGRLKEKGATVTLSKRSHSYFASFSTPSINKPVQTRPLTVLRAKGQPAFAVAHWNKDSGQTSAVIDEFRITAVKGDQ